jgi:hypothetical protein
MQSLLFLWLTAAAVIALFVRPGGIFVGSFFGVFGAGLAVWGLLELRAMRLTITEHRVEYAGRKKWSIDRSSIRNVFASASYIVIDAGAPSRAVIPIYIENPATVLRLLQKKPPNQPPLRMPVSGTPAADAPVAPPPGIAGR